MIFIEQKGKYYKYIWLNINYLCLLKSIHDRIMCCCCKLKIGMWPLRAPTAFLEMGNLFFILGHLLYIYMYILCVVFLLYSSELSWDTLLSVAVDDGVWMLDADAVCDDEDTALKHTINVCDIFLHMCVYLNLYLYMLSL